MTNVKLIIYLSQSHTLNRPRPRITTAAKYFIYLCLATLLCHKSPSSDEHVAMMWTGLKAPFEGIDERCETFCGNEFGLRLFVNNKSRLPRLNPSFVVDFLGIIVFCCYSFSFAPLFTISYQKLFCFFHFTLWKEEKIVCARKCKKGFHRCVLSTPPINEPMNEREKKKILRN